ncbi:non-ribosomal peptide synthetase [Abyssisolibacter fermentans]|uniref:non-ribosomal peptide synthetase n=1 Tax=Abyssisolibacter fermentans TaxID=1766203 RepID=UPI00082A71CA|nr:non-ribosomal peptide synthetase [Abyssisolibacter fermentans]
MENISKNGDIKELINTKQKEYWLSQLSGELQEVQLMSDYDIKERSEIKLKEVSFSIPEELSMKILKLGKSSDLSLYLILLTSLKILVNKYTGIDDIIIGSPMYKYDDEENELANLVALRDKINNETTFKNLLYSIRGTTLEAYENQNYPYEKIIEQLTILNNDNKVSLFGIICEFGNIHKAIEKIPNNCNILISLTRTENNIVGTFRYNSNMYKESTINQVISHYINILDDNINNPQKPINNICMLTDAEIKRILNDFNDTREEFLKNKVVHELFEMQEKKTPNNIAVTFENKEITYKELNEKANQLARLLRKKSTANDTIVSIMVDRSIEMIIAILGTLKAGMVYMPIDPAYPTGRRKYIYEDSKTEILISQKHLLLEDSIELDFFKTDNIVLADDESIYTGESTNLVNTKKSDDLIYILYTSGTTGNPKGVMVKHSNIVNYVHAFLKEFKVNENSKVLQQASNTFDVFVEEVYPTLLSGGCVVIAAVDEIKDILRLTQLIRTKNISLISCSPLLLNEINQLPILPSVKTYISGGDVLKGNYISNIIKTANVYNTYGPTEATVCCSYYKCIGEDITNVPIGRPISNYKAYIFDKNMNLLPIGIPGELCVTGEGVTKGYLNLPEFTNKKYVENPFNSTETMYKTGDLARWLPDGNIEFLGRIDNQVKIRGYRIELKEIENRLLEYEKINNAVVIIKEDSIGDKQLYSYVISDEDITSQEVKEYLKEYLPKYMIPLYIIKIDEMPVTANGKIDYKTLAKLDDSSTIKTAYQAPSTKTEETLVQIWKEVLSIDEKIGVKDNFFELGGHSLRIMKLCVKINNHFNIEVQLTDIYNLQSIEKMAQYIDNSVRKKKNLALEIAEKRDYYPLSPAQNRIFIMNSMIEDNTNYNMPFITRLEGELSKDKLTEVIYKLIMRHETLRTSFENIEGTTVQRINDKIDFKLNYIEKDEKEVVSVIKEFIKPFDLSKAPLCRACLIKIGNNSYIFILDLHHIIFDGVSSTILINDFVKLYNGDELPKQKFQYKDYVLWHQKMELTSWRKKQEEYWLNQFKGEIPILQLPTDYKRPLVKSCVGKDYRFVIDQKITNKLHKLMNETSTTTFMVLLTAYNILLFKYSGQEDIIIGSPIAGRINEDLYSIIGMFVNMIPIRTYPQYTKSFRELLEEVKTKSLGFYENQDYQYEELIDKLKLKRDPARNMLFDCVFSYHEENSVEIQCGKFKLYEYPLENNRSTYDLILKGYENDNKMMMTIEYDSMLFKEETIKEMSENYINIINQVVDNADILLKDIKNSYDTSILDTTSVEIDDGEFVL